jgi:hypothetical protein
MREPQRSAAVADARIRSAQGTTGTLVKSAARVCGDPRVQSETRIATKVLLVTGLMNMTVSSFQGSYVGASGLLAPRPNA